MLSVLSEREMDGQIQVASMGRREFSKASSPSGCRTDSRCSVRCLWGCGYSEAGLKILLLFPSATTRMQGVCLFNTIRPLYPTNPSLHTSPKIAVIKMRQHALGALRIPLTPQQRLPSPGLSRQWPRCPLVGGRVLIHLHQATQEPPPQ